MIESEIKPRVVRIRLLIGLSQGLALYGLYRASQDKFWPATQAFWFAPLLLIAVFVPVMLISGLGHMQRRQLLQWAMLTAITAAGVAVHDNWRLIGTVAVDEPLKPYVPSFLLWIFGIVGFFISHAMVLAGASQKRWIATYTSYFDQAWKLAVQLKFSTLFVGALWLCLLLGAALFDLVHLPFLKELLLKPWFSVPVSVVAFAYGLHLTDVRPAIVRGIRNLLLVLLSWILPIAVLIVGGFLLSLPFQGLETLWATKRASLILLAVLALLLFFVNAAFQNGAVAHEVPAVLRHGARTACLLLVPIALIACYGLGLRVLEYGWTSDRVIVACCLLIAIVYATGYTWAALRSTVWLEGIAKVNTAAAFLILATLLSLFTPILDPARISVASQLSRLASGETSADKFDFDYLKFEGKRYGNEALEGLKSNPPGVDGALIKQRVLSTQAKKYQNDLESSPSLTAEDLTKNLRAWPVGTKLPDSFLKQSWNEVKSSWKLPVCLRSRNDICDVYALNFDNDVQPELLLVPAHHQGNSTVFKLSEKGRWEILGTLPEALAQCEYLRVALQRGNFQLQPSQANSLAIAGQNLELVKDTELDSSNCPTETITSKPKP